MYDALLWTSSTRPVIVVGLTFIYISILYTVHYSWSSPSSSLRKLSERKEDLLLLLFFSFYIYISSSSIIGYFSTLELLNTTR